MRPFPWKRQFHSLQSFTTSHGWWALLLATYRAVVYSSSITIDTAAVAFELGNGITLWHLPVGWVRVREWHRELPQELAEVDDDLRFQ